MSANYTFRMTERFGMNRAVPPQVCPDCNSTLRKAEHAVEVSTRRRGPGGSPSGFYKMCSNSCGCYIAWEFPNVWVRRHVIPIMDEVRTILQDPDGRAGKQRTKERA